MTRPKLSQVTLCCIDSTPRLQWSIDAMQRCLDQLDFADAVLCADRASLGKHVLPDGVRWAEIEPLRSIEAYSAFMLKSLAAHVHTTHVLIVQWDGFVLNAAAWRDEFLACDYIGAPWVGVPGARSVGNGGFSLRSQRLLRALQDPAIEPGHPEDVCICQTHRDALEARGIQFAQPGLARQFAVEAGELTPGIFGFHGLWHLVSVLEPDKVLSLVRSLDTAVVRSDHFRILLTTLEQRARRDAAVRPALSAFEQLIHQTVDAMRGPASASAQGLALCKTLAGVGQLEAAEQLLRLHRGELRQPWAQARLWLRLKKKRMAASLSRH